MKVSPCCGVESPEAKGASVYGCVTCRICDKNGMEIEETEFELKKYQNKPMLEKYVILNHDTPYHNKGELFGYFDGGGVPYLVPETRRTYFFYVKEIINFDYWFSPLKQESPEETIARLEKEVEELKARQIGFGVAGPAVGSVPRGDFFT